MPSDPMIRAWRLADAPSLLRHHRAAPDLHRELPELADVAAAREHLQHLLDDERGWHFALTDNGVAVGNISISPVDRQHSFGWVSYWTAPQARGRGWTSRAVATVADWALFRAPRPVFRLELGHRTNNPASGRVAELAGFVAEGIERQKLCYDGERFDTRTLSRLRTDPRPEVPLLDLEPPAG